MKSVMLIESEFYSRVQIDDDLAKYGYQVTCVKRIKDALIKMKTQAFNMLLMSYDDDIQSALRLLATLRYSNNTIPVVLLAKKPTQDQLIQLMMFRPIEVVVKPYSLVNLLARMDSIGKESH